MPSMLISTKEYSFKNTHSVYVIEMIDILLDSIVQMLSKIV